MITGMECPRTHALDLAKQLAAGRPFIHPQSLNAAFTAQHANAASPDNPLSAVTTLATFADQAHAQ